MSKTGQARVLTPEQFARLLSEIKEHRHKEKNTALIQVSFKCSGLLIPDTNVGGKIATISEVSDGQETTHFFTRVQAGGSQPDARSRI